MSKRVRLLLMLLPLWLGGCVVFERPPAPLACDARLQGRWLPIPNTPEEGAKLTAQDYAVVDAQCRATVSMSQLGNSPASRTEIEVRGFALGGEHYFALDEQSLTRLFARGSAPDPAQEKKLPPTAVTLVRYRIEDDVVTLATIDAATVKDMTGSGGLQATALDEFNYLIPGDEKALRDILLANPRLFENSGSPPMRMRRAAREAAP